MSKMKILRNIIFSMIAVILVSCTGTVDDAAKPVLMAENVEVDLAQPADVVFTVSYNGADVTNSSKIYTTDGLLTLDNAVFSPSEVGEYEFVAEYNGVQSLPLVISVIDTTPAAVESKFVRKVCVAEFTGAWCINCPGGYSNMQLIFSLPAMKKIKDDIHIAAFHSDLEGTDSLAIQATQAVFNKFKGLAYPSYAVDLRDSGLLTKEGIGNFQPDLERSFEKYQAHCGVKVSSVLKPDMNCASVSVELESERTSEYRVIVLVVQDNIRGWQKTTTYPDGQSDYLHNHVVREVVTKYSGTFTGEKITDDGRVAAGSKASKTWEVQLDKKWVLEDTHIYALVLDAAGYVNNMNLCSIDGGDSGYALKQ